MVFEEVAVDEDESAIEVCCVMVQGQKRAGPIRATLKWSHPRYSYSHAQTIKQKNI